MQSEAAAQPEAGDGLSLKGVVVPSTDVHTVQQSKPPPAAVKVCHAAEFIYCCVTWPGGVVVRALDLGL